MTHSALTSDGLFVVKPVLFCAPPFWMPEYWSESAHAWDWVTPETPLDEKPTAEFVVSLDVTLGEVVEASCDAWGIKPGPGMMRMGGKRSAEFCRFAFVREEEDARGVDKQIGYRWPAVLPVPRTDGTVEDAPGLGITFRELLVSAELGLVVGDVSRPYVHPVVPQGTGALINEIVALSSESVRAAYAAIDSAAKSASHTLHLIRVFAPNINDKVNEVLDEAGRVSLLAGAFKKIRGRSRRQ